MERRLLTIDPQLFPASFQPLLTGVPVYDSSCSPTAKVWFIDRDGGYYLKRAPRNSLQKEAALTRFFHEKGLGAEVLSYESPEDDWMLTTRVPGEDCISPAYLENPKRLCDITAEALRMLHSVDPSGCPINRTADYLAAARSNYENKRYDINLFPDNWGYDTPEAAWNVVQERGHLLKADTLLHGDYCLPNIMLDNWKFSGFIDLDTGGLGDRHVDLFWGMWSLNFNLHTDAYRDRFLDVYGRSDIEEELFPVVAAIEVFS